MSRWLPSLAIVLLLVAQLVGPAMPSRAQEGDGAETPTATATETPMLEPTEIPTEVPTATSDPTEIPTDVPEPTEAPTDLPVETAVPTVPPTATAHPTETPSPTPTATPPSENFGVVADAAVDAAQPDANFGAAPELEIRRDPASEVYLRFEIATLDAGVARAVLRVFTDGGTTNAPQVFAAANSWDETTLTWSNRPPRAGEAIANEGDVGAGEWAEYDVTALIDRAGVYTLVLARPAEDGMRIHSREAENNRPRLVLELEPTQAPLPTATPQSTETPLPTETPTLTATPLPTETPSPEATTTAIVTTPAATEESAGEASPVADTAGFVVAAAEQTLTLTPVADAQVLGTSPNSNYGAMTSINVDSSPATEAYLKFTLAGVTGVQSAVLRLFVTNRVDTNGPAVFLADNNWTETGITWNTKPARPGSGVDDKGVIPLGWVEFDVTSLITGSGTFTLSLPPQSSDGLTVNSKENATNRPELVVTFDPTAPVTASASPAGGTYTSAQNVILTASEPATIHYTTDGSDPTTGSAAYASPIPIASTTTLKFFAVTSDGRQSAVVTETYTIDLSAWQTSTIAPDADARVVSTNPTANFGTATTLTVDSSPATESFLRFTVADLAGPVRTATLRLRVTDSTSNGPAVFLAGNDWTETGVTWNTRPAPSGPGVDDRGALSSGTWVEYDVTSLVSGNGTFTFTFPPQHSDAVAFTSKEGSASNRPQLVIAYGGDLPRPTVAASPAGGTYGSAQTVSLTASEPATIHYTTDGSQPTTGSATYASPIPISSTTTLKFFAITSDGRASAVGSETYTVDITDAGVRDFAYGSTALAPTAKEAQSKLWFAQGSWWGLLHSSAASQRGLYVYRLDSTGWTRTGSLIDGRSNAKADVLWDAGAGKLYVVTHRIPATTESGSSTASSVMQLRRFSVSGGLYLPDAGFPTTIAIGTTEVLTVAKDSTGALWVTFTQDNQLVVNQSTDGGITWGTQFVPEVTGTAVTYDDTSAIVAMGGSVGVLWSNQADNTIYFATHPDGAPADQWTGEVAYHIAGQESADDHMNLKAGSDGRVYAVAKTSLNGANDPLIHLLVRETSGSWSSHTVFTASTNATRPVVLLDEAAGLIHVVVAAPCCAGGKLYLKTASLSSLTFPSGMGETVLAKPTDPKINNPTSTKQNLSNYVVLAGDDSTRWYLHANVGS